VDKIYDQITTLGDFAIFSYNAIYGNRDFICTLFDHRAEVERTMNMLNDNHSRQVLATVLKKYQLGEINYSDICASNQYYLPEMYADYHCHNEIVIDAGGYIGDSMQQFIKFFGPKLKRLYSFEPISSNLEQLRQAARRHQGYDIITLPYALDQADGESSLLITKENVSSHLEGRSAHYANAMHLITDSIPVETRALDNLIPPEEKVTFIKMDIEGAEYGALQGARRIISTHKPSLALAIYHDPAHYFLIPQLIKAMVPEYKLYVRHHRKRFTDTVLYAFV
jgi:FkbM family methyltransferase